MAEITVRPLRPEDERSAFTCGEPAIDRFFQHYAGQNQFKLHVATTWVAVDQGLIVGFVAVAAGQLEALNLPDPRLRRRMPGYPLPILRLARLGVDQRAQGRGVGQALVRHTLNLALSLRDTVGCVGVVTDAKAEAAPFYTSLGFVPLDGVREGLLHGDPAPMFLSIQQIAASRR